MAFNKDMIESAKKLKSLDPAVKILVYQDLSSVRSYDGANAVAAPLSYTTALANGWLARDKSGARIAWSNYSGHWQTKVWDAAYQKAWTKNVVEVAATYPWDGIVADNDLSTLKWYTSAVIAGTADAEGTDALLRRGFDQLIAKAGTELNARGKVLFPNVDNGRLTPARWAAHTKFGGGMEEHFMSWSFDFIPDVYSWGFTGWDTQSSLVSTGPATMAITMAHNTDTRTQLYGYGSFLIKAGPGDAWESLDGQTGFPYFPVEASIRLAHPLAVASKSANVWTRAFEGGWVAVNPTQHTQSVKAPAGLRTATGKAVPTSLPPMTAVVARRAS